MDQVVAAEENVMSWYASASKFHIYCKSGNLGLQQAIRSWIS